MQDVTSRILTHEGYVALKCVPYGPVGVCIPYLVRRAQENSDLIAGSASEIERKELWNELFLRAGIIKN
jgi:proline dehydrogenase